MAWMVPKTNWTPVEGVADVDLNRIEGNTLDLKNTKLDSTSYTSADVLAKLLTVDGTGSGLDADSVKGYVPVNKVGDTMTGALSIEGTTAANLLLKAGTQDRAWLEYYADLQAPATRTAYMGSAFAGSSGFFIKNEVLNGELALLTNGGPVTISGSQVWFDGLAPKLIGVNGYQKLPSGLFIQWGMLNVTVGASSTCTFPIAFPTKMVGISAMFEATTTFQAYLTVNSIGLSSCAFYAVTTNGSAGAQLCRWTAVGY
jgi:hypothetical protein